MPINSIMKIDAPHLEKLTSLVSDYQANEIVIPSIQRKKVWNTGDFVSLLNSIHKGFPIGNIVLWTEKVTKNYIDQGEESLDNVIYLLDGQQRISSLAYLLYHKLYEDKEILVNLDDIYFNAKNTINPFSKETKKSKLGLKDYHYNVKSLFDGSGNVNNDDEYWIAQEGVKNSENSKNIIKFMGNLSRTQLSVIDVETIKNSPSDYKSVADLFIAINKSGKLLTSDQLTMARLLPIMKTVDGGINEILLYLAGKPELYPDAISGLTENRVIYYYLGILSAYCFNGEFVHTSKHPALITEKINEKKLSGAFRDTKESIKSAIDEIILAGITDYKLLPHSSFMIVLSYLVRKFDRNHRTEKNAAYNLKKFIYVSILSKDFFRTTEGKLKQAIEAIDSASTMSEAINVIVNDLLLTTNTQVTENYFPLKISNFQSLQTSIHSTAIKEITFLLMQPSDWESKQKLVRTDTSTSNRLEYHHIFPLKQLKLTNIDKGTFHYLANIAFISGLTNNSVINDSLPEKYLPKIDEKLLVEQFVSLDKEEWEIENYDHFIYTRSTNWANFLNDKLSFIES